MGHIFPDPNTLSSVDFEHVVGSDGPDTIFRFPTRAAVPKSQGVFKEGRWKMNGLNPYSSSCTRCTSMLKH